MDGRYFCIDRPLLKNKKQPFRTALDKCNRSILSDLNFNIPPR